MTRHQTTVERAAALLRERPLDETSPAPEPALQHHEPTPASAPPQGRDKAAVRPNEAGDRPEASTHAGAEPGRDASKTSPLVRLDLQRLEARGFVSPHAPTTRAAEEFRLIKRQLLHRINTGTTPRHGGNVMVVTSSAPLEGKTFVSVNLAISLATERDLHVLLVDADVVRPSVFKTLGLTGQQGLVDVLEDETLELSDLIVRTDIAKLSLLHAGSRNSMATELLSSERMTRLLDELATRYPDRIVILDSPPLLAASEASVLAHKCAQVVFVVEAERTSEAMLKSALHLIGDCQNISLILNKSRMSIGSKSFSYYYHSYGDRRR